MMKRLTYSALFALTLILICPSCMVTDGSNAQRKDNKCCGIIKCDMHRRSARTKHKRATTAHKSLRKREARIKRGW